MGEQLITTPEEEAKPKPVVGIIMGSISDEEKMKEAAEILKEFDIPYEIGVVSAHRTPEEMMTYAQTAQERGIKIIIAGAGGAAHLPGMVAAASELPVIGVPITGKVLDGLDSLLSIVQMPEGVPVLTVGINQARNAGLGAIQILATSDPKLAERFGEYKRSLQEKVDAMGDDLTSRGHTKVYRFEGH